MQTWPRPLPCFSLAGRGPPPTWPRLGTGSAPAAPNRLPTPYLVGIILLVHQQHCRDYPREKSPSEPCRSTLPTPIVFLAAAGLPAPRHLATAPARHGPASLTAPPPQRIDDCEWMSTSHLSQGQFTDEWMHKTDRFLDLAFGEAAKGAMQVLCPYSKCANRKRQNKENMGRHLLKNGFTPGYTRWVHHGEAHRMREEVVRPRIEDCDADDGVGDMIHDFHEAEFAEGRTEEEMEASAKAYYDMLSSAQKPLHGQTTVSQLDAIRRVMAFKSQFSLSRDAFDGMLAVFGTLLPEGHILPKSMYESQKLLRALKMPYEQIHACPKGCILFRKEYVEAKYCPKCKSSRFIEVDSADGQKKQLSVPMKILLVIYIVFVIYICEYMWCL